MNLYYQSLMQQIETLIKEQKYHEANDAVRQELAIPYVPDDVLDMLETYKEVIQEHLPSAPASISVEKLDRLIQGNETTQDAAVTMMESLNLHLYLDYARKLLNSSAPDQVKGRLIDILARQRIEEEVEMEKDGLIVRFIPTLISTPQTDETFVKADRLLQNLFENENPTCAFFARSLLEQERLSRLPFDMEDEDVLQLVRAVARCVHEAMGSREDFDEFLRQNQLVHVPDITLHIEK